MKAQVVNEVDSIEALRRAAVALTRMRAQLDALREVSREPVAIVGIACRFPGANTPRELLRLLARGGTATSEVPADRWNIDDFYDPELRPGTMNTRFGGFADAIDRFDHKFFSIAYREACGMDPQQRLLLEVTWEALEDAAIAADSLAGSRSGVFIGISTSDYFRWLNHAPERANTGVVHSIAANRISYALDLRGPSLAIDTACSSSLLAAHLAAQSLRTRECDLAIVGGVNAILHPDATIAFAQAGMMAPDGRCKTFDARADGYVRGEGCGIVVLKRLSDAVRDGDRMYALIRGSATNQDGRSNGLTAPNGDAQASLIREALANAGVRPEEIGYVEAHGTGTRLGDAIEVQALVEALGGARGGRDRCALGAVKANLGHLEAGAGVAGLIKLALAFDSETIFPVAQFRTRNPLFGGDDFPFVIPTAAIPWPRGAERRLAGVSAFSFGGTNVHVVLEEAPLTGGAESVEPDGSRPHLVVLSAKSDAALRALALRYASWLGEASAPPLADVAFTTAAGRAHFSRRLAVIAADHRRLVEELRAFAEGAQPAGTVRGEPDETLQALAQRYVSGEAVAWNEALRGPRARRCALPSYPFERTRCWLDASELAPLARPMRSSAGQNGSGETLAPPRHPQANERSLP